MPNYCKTESLAISFLGTLRSILIVLPGAGGGGIKVITFETKVSLEYTLVDGPGQKKNASKAFGIYSNFKASASTCCSSLFVQV